LDSDIIRIAASIVAQGEFATVDAVVGALCALYRVSQLEQLGVSVASVPGLALLWHMERIIATCLSAFMATHGIAALSDFEVEVFDALLSTSTPSLGGTPLAPSDGFSGYQVGPLARHPAVRARWQPAEPLTPLGYQDAAQHLLAFLALQRPHRRLDVDPAAFARHLTDQTGSSLYQLGIVLVPAALPRVVHALRQATHALAELEVGATRLALDQVHAQQQQQKEQRQWLQQQPRKRPRQQPPEVADAAASRALERPLASRAPPELATPTEPQIARLLSRCRESLGTSHAPTFAATRAAVEAMATPQPKKRGRRAGKQQPVGGGSGGGWPGEGDGESGREHSSDEQLALPRELALLVVTEYLMLHMGKTKWRARKWSHPAPARAPAVTAGASDEGEEGEEGAEGEEDEESEEDEEGEGVVPTAPPLSDAQASAGSRSREEIDSEQREAAVDLEAEVAVATEVATAEVAEAAEPVPLASSELRAGAATASEPPCARLPEALPAEANSEEIDIDDVPAGDPPQSESGPCAEVLIQVQSSVRGLSSSARLPSRLAVRGGGGGGGGGSTLRVGAGSAVSPWHGTLSCLPLDTTDRAAVGRWGEALVYNYLLATLPPERAVTWLNRTEETRAPYDLTVCERGKSAHRGGGGTSSSAVSIFIEVKTTRYRDSNVFDLSYFEWEFMSHEPPVRYHIYHVTGAGDPAGAKITIIEDPVQAMKDESSRLCMAI
jgi:hypothetical protein